MANPLSYLSNVPGDAICAWLEVPFFTIQYYNNRGDYQIGDGPVYKMMEDSQPMTPFEWHSVTQPVEYIGNSLFRSNMTGSINLYFQTRFKSDTTQIQFRILLNGSPIHSYVTPLVHNGFNLDVSMQFSFMVSNGDTIGIDAVGYANVSDTVVKDFDNDGNANTLLKFYK